MEIAKVIRRVMAMRRKAKDQPGTPEGENALRHAIVLEQKHGLAIPDDALDQHSLKIEITHLWQQLLLEVLADLVEVSYFKRGKVVELSGIRIAIDEAAILYDLHKQKIERIATLCALGYMGGAIPEIEQIVLKMSSGNADKSEVTNSDDDDDEIEQFKELIRNPTHLEKRLLVPIRSIGTDNNRPLWESLKKRDA